MIFAIDCGNTRIKWARFEADQRHDRGSASLHGDADPFAALAAALGRAPARVLVANVAGDAVADRIRQSIEAAPGRRPEFVAVEPRAHGVACAYRDPRTLGVDRWLAMIAARRWLTGPYAVVSAGTLVTIDAVDAGGQHLGGLIVPSDRLMIEAMARKAERISVVDPSAGEALPALGIGRSTDEAVRFGARQALTGAIDNALAAVAKFLDSPLSVAVTGGDGARIASWIAADAIVKDDLVLDGLAVVGGEVR